MHHHHQFTDLFKNFQVFLRKPDNISCSSSDPEDAAEEVFLYLSPLADGLGSFLSCYGGNSLKASKSIILLLFRLFEDLFELFLLSVRVSGILGVFMKGAPC